MVSKEIISKSIEKAMHTNIVETVKCPTSSRARKRGTGGVQIGTSFADAPFEADDEYTIEYPDGTRLVFDQFDRLKEIHMDGIDFKYPEHDAAYDDFKYQKESLMKQKAKLDNFHNYNMRGGVMDRYDFETEYDFVMKFADDFASCFGLDLNKKLFNGEKLDHYNDDDGEFLMSPTIITDSDAHVEHFIELERQNRIDGKNIALVTYVRNLHDNDSIDKLSYTSKGFTSTSAGGNDDELRQTFGDNWTVYTVIKEDSNARGLFFGNPLVEGRSNTKIGITYVDWETEVNIPPQTRFTRDLIDEERHIIIQHIERQRGVK